VVTEISVHELKAKWDAGQAPVVIDVREDYELDIARLPNVVHIPMNDIAKRLSELNPGAETIVMCRSGGRSMRVAQFLAAQGFASVANLAGGILAWSAEIDPNVKQY
jgi:sulfur-carrier protein adenylyltransferase/sulfurtransferase